MAGDAVITRAGPVAAPLDYQLPTGTEIMPKVVTATLDGTNAAGSFLAVLEVISPNGTVTAYCLRQESIAAGASASVSWFPGGGVDDATQQAAAAPAVISQLTSPAGTLSVASPTGPQTTIDMPATGVSPTTYGDATHVAQVQVDAEGRITGASSVAISGSGGAGGLIALYDSGYLVAAAASIDTGAGGIASGHFCLIIVGYLRTTAAVGNDNIAMTLNNDSSALYNITRIQANAATPTGAASVLQTSATIGTVPGGNATAKIFGSLEMVVPAYDGSSNFKAGHCTTEAVDAVAGNTVETIIGWTYDSATAISRLKIASTTGGANIAAGSRLVIYGTQ